MSNMDPPSRIPPRNQSHETKSSRDELTSKGKVEKVREVDADETRKRKFLQYYDDDSSTDATAESSPSPFDLYAQDQKKGKANFAAAAPSDSSLGSDVDDGIVPSPAYTPPPDVSALPPPASGEEEDSLPQSNSFWEGTDLPPDQPLPPQRMQETPTSAARIEKESKKTAAPSTSKKKEGSSGKNSKERAPNLEENFHTAKQKKTGSDSQKGDDRPAEQKGPAAPPLALEPTLLATFPLSVQAIAMTATTEASPYIHPSTVSLFFQMVGTMTVMASPRVQRTEIVLNSRNYANSKFFGSTITIEKYATAPDSFNIRLSGPDSAVTAFKEHVPSLMNAFQNGHFTFRVNRLDVEYNPDRPVYRRKEKGEGRGETGGDLGERRK